MIVPLRLLTIRGLLSRPFLTALPDFTKLVAGLGETPANGCLLTPDDGRNLRRRKPFKISKNQNRAVRDRHLCQDKLDLLGQLGLDSGIGIGKLKRYPAITGRSD